MFRFSNESTDTNAVNVCVRGNCPSCFTVSFAGQHCPHLCDFDDLVWGNMEKEEELTQLAHTSCGGCICCVIFFPDKTTVAHPVWLAEALAEPVLHVPLTCYQSNYDLMKTRCSVGVIKKGSALHRRLVGYAGLTKHNGPGGCLPFSAMDGGVSLNLAGRRHENVLHSEFSGLFRLVEPAFMLPPPIVRLPPPSPIVSRRRFRPVAETVTSDDGVSVSVHKRSKITIDLSNPKNHNRN